MTQVSEAFWDTTFMLPDHEDFEGVPMYGTPIAIYETGMVDLVTFSRASYDSTRTLGIYRFSLNDCVVLTPKGEADIIDNL